MARAGEAGRLRRPAAGTDRSNGDGTTAIRPGRCPDPPNGGMAPWSQSGAKTTDMPLSRKRSTVANLRANDCLWGETMRRLFFATLALAFLASAAAHAEGQTRFDRYGEARGPFWDEVYGDGGVTLYCGEAFVGRSGRNIEHVFPAAWMTQGVSRISC